MKKTKSINKLLLSYLFVFGAHIGYSQTFLQADSTQETYALINSIMAPGYDVVETPDCKHTDFGPHITQVHDEELGKDVFAFHSHVNEDNDRCKKEDRARTEIKSYNQSPDSLIGTKGETVVYKWKFKISQDFKPSKKFTHIHQIKAVGGSESSIPTITITLRKTSKEEKLQILHASNNDQEEVAKEDLSKFKGQWIAVEETITYGESGKSSYAIKLSNFNSGKSLLEFSSENLRMWKTDADFLRPKWGIYRSILEPSTIKDEIIFFADFEIQEVR